MSDAEVGVGREQRELTLSNGSLVLAKPIEAEDASALKRLYERLSERTLFFRFFQPRHELTDEQAHRLTHLDGKSRFALVALDPKDPQEIIAVVRYEGNLGSNRAEYAALVEDRWQESELGLKLTEWLVEAARERGIELLYAEVLADNKRMINLFRDLGLPEHTKREDRMEQIEIEL